jgi:hypothetical protein
MSPEEVTGFLRRTAEDVRAKARDLGLIRGRGPTAEREPDIRRLAAILHEAEKALDAWPEALKR